MAILLATGDAVPRLDDRATPGSAAAILAEVQRPLLLGNVQHCPGECPAWSVEECPQHRPFADPRIVRAALMQVRAMVAADDRLHLLRSHASHEASQGSGAKVGQSIVRHGVPPSPNHWVV